jgi:hypothetical protein
MGSLPSDQGHGIAKWLPEILATSLYSQNLEKMICYMGREPLKVELIPLTLV